MLSRVAFADCSAEPLTEEEVAEKDALVGDGFPDWQRRHFLAFIKSLERYGREALDKVALEVPDKTEEDVREYADVFFERYTELKGGSGVACCHGFSTSACIGMMID